METRVELESVSSPGRRAAAQPGCVNGTYGVFCVINLDGKFPACSRGNATLSARYYSSHFTSEKRQRAEESGPGWCPSWAD